MATQKGGPNGPIVVNRFDPGVLDNGILDDLSDKKVNQPYILDLITLERLWFQTIPQNIKVNAESVFVSLASPGRNVPFYNYSGSEKTIQFTITWYANHVSYIDVITKCKWLESLTMADGYDAKPHPLQFVFGDLFKNAKWLLKSAPYEIGLFDRPNGMLPKLASQELTLLRISDKNLSRSTNLKYNY